MSGASPYQHVPENRAPYLKDHMKNNSMISDERHYIETWCSIILPPSKGSVTSMVAQAKEEAANDEAADEAK